MNHLRNKYCGWMRRRFACVVFSASVGTSAEAGVRLMLRDGIGFEAGALGGVASSELVRLTESCAANHHLLLSSSASYASLEVSEAQIAQLRKAIQDCGDSPTVSAQLAQAEVNCVAARQQYESARAAFREAVLAPLANTLPPHDYLMLTRAVANHDRAVPPEFRVLELSEAQWATLESALKRRTAPEPNLSTDEHQMLTFADTHPDVMLARSRLQTHLPALEQAFAAALLEELSGSSVPQ